MTRGASTAETYKTGLLIFPFEYELCGVADGSKTVDPRSANFTFHMSSKNIRQNHKEA